jgi:hypothetical protein
MFGKLIGESIFKKIIIASNFDGNFDQYAVHNARLFLSSSDGEIRDESALDLEKIWVESTREMQEAAKCCSLCRSEDIAYYEEIYFCTEEIKDIDENGMIDLPDFIHEICSDKKIGIVRTKKTNGFVYATGSFKLCTQCLKSPIRNKKGILKINMNEYYEYPMYKYYEALGFNRIKQHLD